MDGSIGEWHKAIHGMMVEGGPDDLYSLQRTITKETYIDLKDEMGIFTISVLHCLNCGEVVDPLILQHRLSAPAPIAGRARVSPKTWLAGSGAKR